MKYLFLDSSDPHTLGQIGTAESFRTFHWETRRDLTARLPEVLQEMLQATGIKAEELDVVGVCLGPGSLTGLRVGLSFLRTWCFLKNLPLVGVDLFSWGRQTLHLSGRSGPAHLVCPAFLGHFFHRFSPGGSEVFPPPTLKKTGELLPGEIPVFSIRRPTGLGELLEPTPEALHSVLTTAAIPPADFEHLLSVSPLYIVPSQAELNLKGKNPAC
jgi:hypothetical protein